MGLFVSLGLAPIEIHLVANALPRRHSRGHHRRVEPPREYRLLGERREGRLAGYRRNAAWVDLPRCIDYGGDLCALSLEATPLTCWIPGNRVAFNGARGTASLL